MKTLAALIFPGFEPLDLYGPLEMFAFLSDDYAIKVVAPTAGQVKSSRSISGWAEASLDETPEADLVLVPGGPGSRDAIKDAALLDWVASVSAKAEITMSVCTGSLILAKAKVITGRKATTNKMVFEEIESANPDTDWVRRARWVEDGDIFTSSGVSAGMDMSLAVIERLHGRAEAERVAMICEYTWHDRADDDPFAEAHGLV